MNKDFRISVALPSHPKALKLMRRCGDIAFYNLVKFWAFVAQNKPNGRLTNIDKDDIEIASGWIGQYSEFYQALLDLRFIECIDGVLVVHDWNDHNGFACHAEDRSLKAKKAAEARWSKRNDAKSMQRAMQDDATSNAPSPSPTPSPIPTPSLKDNPLTPHSGGNVEYSKSFDEWWSIYPNKVGKLAAYKSWQKIGKSKSASVSELTNSLKRQIESNHFRGTDGQDYIPKPATWLNQGRWMDEIKTGSSEPRRPRPPMFDPDNQYGDE